MIATREKPSTAAMAISLGSSVFAVMGVSSASAVTVYTAEADFNAATSGFQASNTINWDGPVFGEGESAEITDASMYSSELAGPTLIDADDDGTIGSIGNPNEDRPNGGGPNDFYGGNFVAVSGDNVFAPPNSVDDNPANSSPDGILGIEFSETVNAIGAYFLDAEVAATQTGIRLDRTLYSFEQPQGDRSQRFLGVVSEAGFNRVELQLGVPLVNDGVGIDDVTYAVIPTPSAADGVLAMLAAGACVVGGRRRRAEA